QAGTAAPARPSPGELRRLRREVDDERRVPAPQRQRLPPDFRPHYAGQPTSKGEQPAVVVSHPRRLAPGELRAAEGLRVLRVGDVVAGERRPRRELPPAALAGRLRGRRVDVVGEELERIRLAV